MTLKTICVKIWRGARNNQYFPIYCSTPVELQFAAATDNTWHVRFDIDLQEDKSWKHEVLTTLKDHLGLLIMATSFEVQSLKLRVDALDATVEGAIILDSLVKLATTKLSQYPDENFPDEKISWTDQLTGFIITIELLSEQEEEHPFENTAHDCRATH